MSGWSDIQSGIAGQRDALVESLKMPQERQAHLLRRIVDRNHETEFGRRFDFRGVRTIADYRDSVPPQSYNDISADIDRMMAGEKNVLCAEAVLLFEQTGGSTGGNKFLPYTESAMTAVRRAILPWLDDLLISRPGIAKGRAYWAISPAVRQQSRTPCGIRIGIDNDAAYFGADLAQAIGDTLAVPAAVASITSFDAWRKATVDHLLKCRDLSFVSVWSPTFFLQLLDAIPGDVEDLWPMLDTISCWCSSSSRRYANELAERLPAAGIQGKGLLATEGVVTVPLTGACSPVLAIESGFYEFAADSGDIVLPWELETGKTYGVLLTTEAGLYRYRLGDRVLVSGLYEATPCLEYVGREGGGSDLCGEKLTEEFVEAALGNMPGFGFIVPISEPRPSYLLVLDADIVTVDEESNVAKAADDELMRNPQYKYARAIGQLPRLAPHRTADPLGMYQQVCIRSGQRLGDIKPAAIASIKWGEQFDRAMEN